MGGATSPQRVSRWTAGTPLGGEPAVGARYRIDVGDGAEPPSWDGTFARVLPAYRATYPDLPTG